MADIIKQIIVVRKDLEMPAGKLAGQVAHASMGAFLLQMPDNRMDGRYLDFDEYPDTRKWLDGPFRKIVLYVKSEEKLLNSYNKIKEAGFNVSLITDVGHTFFDKPTTTCFGVEPLASSKIDPFVKRLQLLK